MANKNIYSRMQQKHDVEANWNKATNFIPLAGEIIVYDADENNLNPRIKIGDGLSYIVNLPFMENLDFVISPIAPEKTTVLWIDTSENGDSGINEIINGGTW